jgi:CSLREA domain-containing protein
VRARAARRVVGAVLTAALLAPGTAGAATFTVNTTADHTGPCDAADCTLREAMIAAANNTGVQDSIVVPANAYVLDGQLGELVLSGDILTGAGARSTIIDGGLATRVIAAQVDGSTSPQISGLTIRRGNGVGSTPPTGSGGGVFVASGTLGLANSQVIGNAASGDGGGIYLDGGTDLVAVGSTVAGNVTSGGDGGGIYSDNEGLVFALNSTISGNVAVEGSGGGLYAGPGGTSLFLTNATVAGNRAIAGGGVLGDDPTFADTILAENVGGACSLTTTASSNNTLSTDTSCGLAGVGDVQGVNPGLGPLTNNGGPTDTRAIGPTSPATDHGGAGCQATDQRGVARPQGGACDIGAYEYRAPTLTVRKVVVNDDAGTKTPAAFNVHVRAGGTDVTGSPQPGTASGRTYVLAPGAYTVSEDAIKSYTSSMSGACAADGTVTLAEGQAMTCTITNDDKPPVVGKTLNVKPDKGKVRVRLPGGKWRRLTGGEQLPRGTRVDTRKGRITLVAAYKKGGTATADFYDGIFTIWQGKKGKRPITTVRLVEKLRCSTTGKAAKSDATTAKKKKRKRKRRLWGNGKGRFRTKGKHSAATVVGTKWLVEDRCTSTLTKVKRGKVKVRDFVKHKTITVRKGRRYVARSRG